MDSPSQYRNLEQQVRWVNSITDKPTSIEIVWGHNVIEIPEHKQRLMSDVKSWGIDIIGTDYAPIGGWSEPEHMLPSAGTELVWPCRVSGSRDLRRQLPPFVSSSPPLQLPPAAAQMRVAGCLTTSS